MLGPRTLGTAAARVLAGATVAAGAGWTVRHATSPAVRAWARPQAGQVRRAGALQVRATAPGAAAVVLLHGLAGNHLMWGRAYDGLARGRRLVCPDLLGFGGSLDPDRDDHDLQAHLDALDAMAAELGLDGVPLLVAGHSMGAVLALSWAARRPETQRVVALCAPLYDGGAEADAHIAGMGAFERLFALEGPLAHAACRTMCRYRDAAQWAAVALTPHLPVPIARSGVLHTWPSYLGAMNGVIRSGAWASALADLDERGVPVELAEAAADPVPVCGRALALAGRHACVRVHRHPDGEHDLPITHPRWCLQLLGPE